MRRPIPFRISIVLSALAVLASVSLAHAANGDVRGSRDYPGIERFAGSVITGYEARESDRTRLQTAPFKNGDATGDLRPEGRVTRVAYRIDPGPSMLQVAQSFEAQFAQAGYETVFACEAEVCGGVHFSMGIDVLYAPFMWVNGVNYHYFAGRRTGDDGAETWATVLVSHHGEVVTAQLVVTEVAAPAAQ